MDKAVVGPPPVLVMIICRGFPVKAAFVTGSLTDNAKFIVLALKIGVP